MSEHKQILQSLAKKVSTEPNSGGGCEDNIQTEAVNYVGYYSTHEQSMEAVMHLQASRTGKSIFQYKSYPSNLSFMGKFVESEKVTRQDFRHSVPPTGKFMH